MSLFSSSTPQVLRTRSAKPQVTLPEINFKAKIESSSKVEEIHKKSHCSKVSARLGVVTAPPSLEDPETLGMCEVFARLRGSALLSFRLTPMVWWVRPWLLGFCPICSSPSCHLQWTPRFALSGVSPHLPRRSSRAAPWASAVLVSFSMSRGTSCPCGAACRQSMALMRWVSTSKAAKISLCTRRSATVPNVISALRCAADIPCRST